MAKKTETIARDTDYHEFLLRLTDADDLADRRRIRWAKRIGFAFIIVGLAALLWFANDFFWLYLHLESGKMHPEAFAKFRAHFGDAIAGASALTSLGVVIYSFSFIAEQIAGERESRRQQDMPVVLIAPRLNWAVTGIYDGEMAVSGLALMLGIRNVANAAATRLIIKCQLKYTTGPEAEESVTLPGSNPYVIDYLAGRSATGRDDSEFEHHRAFPLPHQCVALIKSLLNNPVEKAAEYPLLVLHLTASCETIREASFFCSGKAIWSPKHCLGAAVQQNTLLTEFASAWSHFDPKKGGDLDKFFKQSREHPLVPLVKHENQ